jgi:predicted ATPase
MQGERVFLDRGQVDGWAYYLKDDKEPSSKMLVAMEEVKKDRRFKKVFLIENFSGVIATKERRENLDEAIQLENLQEQNYRSLGFEVVRIPPMPLEERVVLILKYVSEK